MFVVSKAVTHTVQPLIVVEHREAGFGTDRVEVQNRGVEVVPDELGPRDREVPRFDFVSARGNVHRRPKCVGEICLSQTSLSEGRPFR